MSEYIVCPHCHNPLSSSEYVKVIRCRDCKHFTYADATHGNDDWCAKHEHIGWSVNGFCAWAERRDA
jgi:uncharacterized CHY-type Zn-finger protein